MWPTLRGNNLLAYARYDGQSLKAQALSLCGRRWFAGLAYLRACTKLPLVQVMLVDNIEAVEWVHMGQALIQLGHDPGFDALELPSPCQFECSGQLGCAVPIQPHVVGRSKG